MEVDGGEEQHLRGTVLPGHQPPQPVTAQSLVTLKHYRMSAPGGYTIACHLMTQEAVTSYEDTQPCGGQSHTQLGGWGLLDNQIGQQFDFLLSELHASDAPEGCEQPE